MIFLKWCHFYVKEIFSDTMLEKKEQNFRRKSVNYSTSLFPVRRNVLQSVCCCFIPSNLVFFSSICIIMLCFYKKFIQKLELLRGLTQSAVLFFFVILNLNYFELHFLTRGLVHIILIFVLDNLVYHFSSLFYNSGLYFNDFAFVQRCVWVRVLLIGRFENQRVDANS